MTRIPLISAIKTWIACSGMSTTLHAIHHSRHAPISNQVAAEFQMLLHEGVVETIRADIRGSRRRVYLAYRSSAP
ncbi:unnamed protein product [Calypogeia fissa]